MKKLIEVENAKAIMTEAIDWSVMKWLSEKKKVRQLADAANATLDRVEAEAQQLWNEELRSAVKKNSGNGELRELAKSLRESHDAAIQMRMTAEETFDKAERRLSVAMAREGCEQALKGWALHEEAIRRAESAATVSKK